MRASAHKRANLETVLATLHVFDSPERCRGRQRCRVDFSEVHARRRLDGHRVEVKRYEGLPSAPLRASTACRTTSAGSPRARPIARARRSRGSRSYAFAVPAVRAPASRTKPSAVSRSSEVDRHDRAHEQGLGPSVLVPIPLVNVASTQQIRQGSVRVTQARIRETDVGERARYLEAHAYGQIDLNRLERERDRIFIPTLNEHCVRERVLAACFETSCTALPENGDSVDVSFHRLVYPADSKKQ